MGSNQSAPLPDRQLEELRRSFDKIVERRRDLQESVQWLSRTLIVLFGLYASAGAIIVRTVSRNQIPGLLIGISTIIFLISVGMAGYALSGSIGTWIEIGGEIGQTQPVTTALDTEDYLAAYAVWIHKAEQRNQRIADAVYTYSKVMAISVVLFLIATGFLIFGF